MLPNSIALLELLTELREEAYGRASVRKKLMQGLVLEAGVAALRRWATSPTKGSSCKASKPKSCAILFASWSASGSCAAQ